MTSGIESLKRVLVVTAHPDDSEFSSGGTVSLLTQQGTAVFYLICTNGDKGTSDPDMTSLLLAPVREQEQRNAAAVLGVQDVTFLGYGDGNLEATSELREKIVRHIRLLKPDAVFTFDPSRSPGSSHRDHRNVGVTAVDSVFPYARDRLHYPEHETQGLSPHKVRELYLFGSDDPDTIVDISDTVNIKVQALSQHLSQVGHRLNQGFSESIHQRAADVGSNHGIRYAEAFRRIGLSIPAS